MAKGLQPHTRKHKLAYMIVTIELESLSEEELHSRFNALEFGSAVPLHKMTITELEDTLDDLGSIAAPRYQNAIAELLRDKLRVGEFLAEDDLGFVGTKMGSYPTERGAYEAYTSAHKGRKPRHILKLTEVPPGGNLAGWVVWDKGDKPPK